MVFGQPLCTCLLTYLTYKHTFSLSYFIISVAGLYGILSSNINKRALETYVSSFKKKRGEAVSMVWKLLCLWCFLLSHLLRMPDQSLQRNFVFYLFIYGCVGSSFLCEGFL